MTWLSDTLSGLVLSSTEHPCPTPSYPPNAAEDALWACADAAADMAFWALVFTIIALYGSFTALVILKYLEMQR